MATVHRVKYCTMKQLHFKEQTWLWKRCWYISFQKNCAFWSSNPRTWRLGGWLSEGVFYVEVFLLSFSRTWNFKGPFWHTDSVLSPIVFLYQLHAHSSNQCRQFLLRFHPQMMIDCVKLTIKVKHSVLSTWSHPWPPSDLNSLLLGQLLKWSEEQPNIWHMWLDGAVTIQNVVTN